MSLTGEADGPTPAQEQTGTLGALAAGAITTGPIADGPVTTSVAPPISRRRPDEAKVLEAAGRLRAVTFEVDPAAVPDLVRAGGHPGRYLWARNELAILGSGEALRLPLPSGWAAADHTLLVREALAAIQTEARPERPGWGPVAIGALPYDPARGGHLSVPRLLVTLGHGRAWATLTGAGETGPLVASRAAVEEELAGLTGDLAAGVLPDRFELAAVMPHEEWKHLVAKAVKEMDGGSMSKVVVARQVEVVANRPFLLPETLSRLAHLYPSCAVFHVEGFLGASPETLLRRTGTEIESHPLAGTVARSGDPATDDALVAALLSSSKDRHEHQLVVDEIVAKLRRFATLNVPAAPSIMPLRNVSHLGTSIKGTLHAGAADGASHSNGHRRGGHLGAVLPAGLERPGSLDLPTSLDLAAVLQPTPAVGGLPVEAAIEWQRQNEGFDRGCYAGPVGWVDSNGDGEWVLGLRSAHVSGPRAVMYAGNGIVAGSDPEVELGETQLKLQALLAALVRP